MPLSIIAENLIIIIVIIATIMRVYFTPGTTLDALRES